MLPTLYASDKSIAAAPQTHRWYVQLASHELDGDGEPARWVIADVMTVVPGEKAIRKVLNDAGILSDWAVIEIWEPDFSEAPF